MKRWLTIFTFTIFFFLLKTWALAAEFQFDYDLNYDISSSGNTHVTQNITLTNNVTNFYASNYTLTIFSERIEDIAARDPLGKITPVVTKADGQTQVLVPFNIKSVGLGNKFTFTLSYNSLDIATKKGQIWEVIIPGIEKNADIGSYTVQINVPPSFGTPSYISPQPGTDGKWNLAELQGGGIAITYGSVQHYSFNLIYHLENPDSKQRIMEITLPPDTPYQKVVLNRLSVLPGQVRLDRDGNWLAQYQLAAGETKKIIADGSVLIYAQPRANFKQVLTSEDKKIYTSEQAFWDQTPEIKNLGISLATPKNIYDYVVKNLTYDYGRIEPGIKRLGALTALNNPQNAVCMEFSDLYIALARAAGIPAREVHGYAYTTNSKLQPLSLISDVLHAWVEYYDPARQIWVPIDPTWGNTTRGIDYFTNLDLNHIALAILGEKSDYPFPAGSFKGNTDGKNVYVDFAQGQPESPDPTFQVSLISASPQLAGSTLSGVLRIKNTGQVLYQPHELHILSKYPVDYNNEALPGIPPFGSIDIPFTSQTKFTISGETLSLAATVDLEQATTTIALQPFYQFYLLPIMGIGALVTIFVILTLHVKRAKKPGY